jgi:hypothetical protein
MMLQHDEHVLLHLSSGQTVFAAPCISMSLQPAVGVACRSLAISCADGMASDHHSAVIIVFFVRRVRYVSPTYMYSIQQVIA